MPDTTDATTHFKLSRLRLLNAFAVSTLNVPYNISLLPKTLTAIVTLVRLCIRMRLLVSNAMLLCLKTFPAKLAQKRPLPGVIPAVGVKIRPPRKAFEALLTIERRPFDAPLVMPFLQVTSESALLPEPFPAQFADERLHLFRVRQSVPRQARVRLESFAAVGTGKRSVVAVAQQVHSVAVFSLERLAADVARVGTFGGVHGAVPVEE